jgi:hypothetical protein
MDVGGTKKHEKGQQLAPVQVVFSLHLAWGQDVF